MAEVESQQPGSNPKPIKKRRFFRPKPKAKTMDSQTTEGKQATKPQATQAKPEKAVASKENSGKQNKPKQQNVKEQPNSLPKQQQKPAKPNKAQKANTIAKATEQPSSQVKVKQTNQSTKADKNKQNIPDQRKNTSSVQSSSEKLRKTEKPQIKQAKQTAHKSAAKINSQFRTHRPLKTAKLSAKDINFKYLDNPEFQDIYILVAKAQSYMATDMETCCAKFRIANEAIIERLITDLQLKEAVVKKEMETNYFEQINLLKEKIPTDMVEPNIFAEMHNIRMIGNSFAHGDDKYEAPKGSKTCLIAMEKICRWLVEFEPKYKSYQRAKAVTSSNILKDIWNALLSLFKCK